jgi:trans-aconitate methyltransferase
MNDHKSQQRYNWDAGDYAENSAAQQTWAKELIGRLTLSGNETVLDIGCGDGKVTAEIASLLPDGEVLGIDSSEVMISLATQTFPSDRYTNLCFEHQDATALDFFNRFDAAFSNAALHWIIDHRPLLQGLQRALKPGGRVVVQMGGKGNAAQVISAAEAVLQSDRWHPYFRSFAFPYGFYSPEEYRPWLEEAGFQVASIDLKPKDMVHESASRFKGWFRTTWLPYIERVPQKMRERFVDQVVQTYTETFPPDEDGRIHTPMQRLEYIALKQGS